MHRLVPCVLLAAGPLLPGGLVAQTSRFEIEVEAGAVWQSRNDVEVPNDGTATRFSLRDVVGSGPWATGRVHLEWRRSESQSLRLLYAPLTVTSEGVLAEPIEFADASYAAGARTRGRYTFNSYRLTYRWRLHHGERSSAWLGFTAKVRDAAIVLTQGATTSRTDDLGFVPLLHLSGERRVGALRLALDADALAGGPGRAVDAALKLAYDLNDRWTIQAGYRTVEGGADVESVYNFAWLHYAVASIAVRP